MEGEYTKEERLVAAENLLRKIYINRDGLGHHPMCDLAARLGRERWCATCEIINRVSRWAELTGNDY